MSTLSVSELQTQVETDLSSTALQLIIDSVERDIEEQHGPTTGYVHEYHNAQYQTVLRLPVEAASITTVVEYTDAASEPTKTTLSANDYGLSDNGWWLRRRSDGDNARDVWGWRVVVTFEPADDTERRKQVAIELARLEIVHSGYSREGVGDWSGTTREYDAERARILRRLDQTLVS